MDAWRWLASTVELQRDFYGHDFNNVPSDERGDSFIMNHSAAVVELAEALAETGWKPWAHPRGWVNHDAFLGEIVDALHFVANMLCNAGVTDDELWSAYQAKQEVNRQRQRDGYTDRRAPKPMSEDAVLACRTKVSFWAPDELTVPKLIDAAAAIDGAYALHGAERFGNSFVLDATYTSKGANAADVRRYAAKLAAAAGWPLPMIGGEAVPGEHVVSQVGPSVITQVE